MHLVELLDCYIFMMQCTTNTTKPKVKEWLGERCNGLWHRGS